VGSSNNDNNPHITSSSPTLNTPDHIEDFPETDYPSFDNNNIPPSCLVVSLEDPTLQPSSHHLAPDHSHFFTEPENMPRKMRIRPTPQQMEELKKLYNINPHPTKDEREDLGERIGM
jgi:hypothetical protein